MKLVRLLIGRKSNDLPPKAITPQGATDRASTSTEAVVLDVPKRYLLSMDSPMISALIFATFLQARAEIIARAVIWGRLHEHSAIEFDRCKRRKNRMKCLIERDENNRRACRFIMRESCKL